MAGKKTLEFGDGPQALYENAMQPAFDVTRARRETPGTEHVLHFNNAGAALMPECVMEAVNRHLQLELETGGYEAATRAERPLARVYDAAASLLNGAADEIAVVENATRGWDMVFYAFDFRPGDRILTCTTEYASNYIAYLQVAKRTGAVVETVSADESGQIDVAALENLMDERVKLVSISHVPTNGGLVNPAAEVGRVAKAAGVPYLLDACQSVGQMPIDVEAIGCDALSTTGRKYLRGPRGTGLLWLRRELIEALEPPFLDLHAATWTGEQSYSVRGDARRFENWESYVAGKAGLCAAIEYAQAWGLEAIYERIQDLAEALRADLGAIKGVTVQDLGVEKCGIVSFSKDGTEPDAIKEALAEQAINVSVTNLPDTLLDAQARGNQIYVRASVHYYNSEDEVARFCEAVEGAN